LDAKRDLSKFQYFSLRSTRCETFAVGSTLDAISHLWPEPLNGPWNAHMKDRLENRIHELVCGRVITLAQGRAAFLGDWTAAYTRYLGRP
jgi:hypothetical protein